MNDPQTYWSDILFNLFDSIFAFLSVTWFLLMLERWDGQRLINPHKKFALHAWQPKEKAPSVRKTEDVDKPEKECEHTVAPIFSTNPYALAGHGNHPAPILDPGSAHTMLSRPISSHPISPHTISHLRRPYTMMFDGSSDVCVCKPVIHVTPNCPIHGDYFDPKECDVEGSDEKEECYVYA